MTWPNDGCSGRDRRVEQRAAARDPKPGGIDPKQFAADRGPDGLLILTRDVSRRPIFTILRHQKLPFLSGQTCFGSASSARITTGQGRSTKKAGWSSAGQYASTRAFLRQRCRQTSSKEKVSQGGLALHGASTAGLQGLAEQGSHVMLFRQTAANKMAQQERILPGRE
ncbi:hypothetical protein WJX84_008372 [Apatococcus fuscideae]|uniref:Uncharacterized protein n=1 Tax=Apatococcus fuscideae TaxID=2026836 RepID=A0AAW1SSH0_9CHLO